MNLYYSSSSGLAVHTGTLAINVIQVDIKEFQEW